MITAEKMEKAAKDCGALRTARIPAADIQVDSGFRASCEMNQCGAYGCRWSCPPVLPSVGEMHKDLRQYTEAVLFQADFPLGDIFDYAAMEEGAAAFYRLCRCIEKHLQKDEGTFLLLGAGACRECAGCTYPKAPCVRPQGPVMSLEAYGVDVTALVRSAALPYNISPDLVTYTGLILASPAEAGRC